MNSFKHLHDDWTAVHANLKQKIRESETGHVISSDLQYATAAWHNKLKVWCEELDQLMAEYSPKFGHGRLTSLRKARLTDESVERPQDRDAARVRGAPEPVGSERSCD